MSWQYLQTQEGYRMVFLFLFLFLVLLLRVFYFILKKKTLYPFVHPINAFSKLYEILNRVFMGLQCYPGEADLVIARAVLL